MTKSIFDFFATKATNMGYRHQSEYMTIDQVWWSEANEIVLALEHEGQVRNVGKVFEQEVRHLLDIKAIRKVLIAYVSEPDEKSLISNLVNWLKTRTLRLTYPAEEYMIILGRPTRKLGKPVLLYRRYLFNYQGTEISRPEDFALSQPQDIEVTAH